MRGCKKSGNLKKKKLLILLYLSVLFISLEMKMMIGDPNIFSSFIRIFCCHPVTVYVTQYDVTGEPSCVGVEPALTCPPPTLPPTYQPQQIRSLGVSCTCKPFTSNKLSLCLTCIIICKQNFHHHQCHIVQLGPRFKLKSKPRSKAEP